MNPATIAALNWLSFAALIVAGIGCLVCAGWMLTMIRLGRAESASPLPMREDPRYRGTDFRAAINAARKEVQP